MIDVGATVGNYQVVSLIGRGAMGSVYLAQHPVIGKRVALKVIHPELIHNPEVVARFFNEARAITQIGNPHVVEVQDFFQAPDGECVIIMELLEGTNLAERLKLKGTLSVERAIHIAIQICDALGAAHERQIIHRDVKPDNILLITRGVDEDFVKVVDFGLAKLTAPGGMLHRTKTGTMLGTPYYMAPEAAEAKKPVDHRVDIYALGCILFQMVTGRVPFLGDGYGDVLIKHVIEPPPLPTRLNPQVPPAVEKIILHALAKKPEFRFATMEKFKKALQDPTTFARGIHDPAFMTHPEGVDASNLAATLLPAPTFEEAPRTLSDPAPQKLAPDADTLVAADLPEEVKKARAIAQSKLAAAQTMIKPENQAEVGRSATVPQATPTPQPTQMAPAPAVVGPTRSKEVAHDTGAVRPLSESRPRVRSSPGGPIAIGIGVGVGGSALLFLIGVLLVQFVFKPLGWMSSEVSIAVSSQPAGAQVFVGDRMVGTTPVMLRVPSGQSPVRVQLKKEDFVDADRDVIPSEDRTISVKLLERPRPEPTRAPEPSPTPAPAASPAPAPEAPPVLKKRKRPAGDKRPSGDSMLLAPSF